MIGLEKGITKEAVRMAWPAVCVNRFLLLWRVWWIHLWSVPWEPAQWQL
ncbi:unknown [Roseburia sp. CAG:100]|nr:unknown [Roseburia sp. CAG:100]